MAQNKGIPLVSVIMPTYNCGKYIGQAVQSVVHQSISDWEIVIVDDGSTDDTLQVLRPFLEKYPAIHYVGHDSNIGPGLARTEAIQRSRGKYVAFLDSDDMWHPQKLEKQVAFMERHGALFSCTAYEKMDDDGNGTGKVFVPPPVTDYKRMIRLSDPIGNLTAMYNQEALGKYEVPDIRKRNDFALWLRILRDASCCMGLEEVLAYYRFRSDSLSRNKFTLVKYHWELYHRVEQLSFFHSCCGVVCWMFVKGTGIGLDRRTLQRSTMLEWKQQIPSMDE